MASQQLSYENSFGKLTFVSQVKYRLPDGDFQKATMPCWDGVSGVLALANAGVRTVSDASFLYTFEAAPLAGGFKIRLGVRNNLSQTIELGYLAPVVSGVNEPAAVLGNQGPKVSWLRGLGYQSSSPAAPINVDTRQSRGWLSLQRDMADNCYPDRALEAGLAILDWQALISNGKQTLLFSALTSAKGVSQALVKTTKGQLVLVRFATLLDKILLEPGAEVFSDWLYLTITDRPLAALEEATSLWGQQMQARCSDRVMAGWFSQLRYKNRITPKQMAENLNFLKEMGSKLPIDYFVVDDGYEGAIGDWLEACRHRPSLPELLAPIEKTPFMKGVWLAPFVCQSDSKLMHDHPDWLLKDVAGRARVAGINSNWHGRFYALDCTNPAFLNELKHWFTTIYQMGVRFFKVDFAYAGALSGQRFDPHVTGLEALRNALSIIREAIGDAYLDLGAVPFGAAVGYADAMRIGPTVERFWQSQLQILSSGSNSFPAAANSVEGTLNRWYLHKNLAHVMPSWVLSGTIAGNKLSPAQLRTLYTSIVLSGGGVNIGENLLEVGDNCQEFARLLPLHNYKAEALVLDNSPVPQVFRIRNQNGDRQLIAFFNWSSEITTKALSLQQIRQSGAAGFHLYDPWENTYYGIWSQNELKAYNIPAYGCRVFLATQVSEDPQLIGVSPMIMGHLLSGVVTSYDRNRAEFTLTLNGFKGRRLECWLYYPSWCLNQYVKVSGGSLLENKKRGPIISYCFDCDEDNTEVFIRCLNQ